MPLSTIETHHDPAEKLVHGFRDAIGALLLSASITGSAMQAPQQPGPSDLFMRSDNAPMQTPNDQPGQGQLPQRGRGRYLKEEIKPKDEDLS